MYGIIKMQYMKDSFLQMLPSDTFMTHSNALNTRTKKVLEENKRKIKNMKITIP